MTLEMKKLYKRGRLRGKDIYYFYYFDKNIEKTFILEQFHYHRNENNPQRLVKVRVLDQNHRLLWDVLLTV